MSDTLESLAYDEAIRAIGEQAGVLDGLRSRAGTLLAAASLVTSFLGGQALAKPTITDGAVVSPDVGTWGWVAIAMFVGLAVVSILILLPYQWRFVMSPTIILSAGEGGDPVTFTEAQAQLATYHEENYDSNQQRLDRLFWGFRVACVFLAGETVAWIIDFGA
jgi:hypothetical protein